MGRTVGTHQLSECENRVLHSLLLQVLLDYFYSTAIVMLVLGLQRPLSPSLEWISDHLSSLFSPPSPPLHLFPRFGV